MFGTAPRELARAVSLQHAVEMVRVIIDTVEAQVDELAAPGGEAELREAVLTYAREIAFSAAQVYARTAEARGAWDARLEALVVDSLVRGVSEDSLHSWASALSWSSSPVVVVVGMIEDGLADGTEPHIDEIRAQARRARLDLLAGVQEDRLILVLGGTDDPIAAAERFAGSGRGRSSPGRWSATCGPRRSPRAPPWRRCAPLPPGPRRRARPGPTTCCPSVPWTATPTPGPR